MATIQKRKWSKSVSWFAQVRRKGFKTLVKSFSTRTEAKKWARAMENKLGRGDYSDYSEASKVTLGDLFKRYISENKHRGKKNGVMKNIVRTNYLKIQLATLIY